MMCSWRSVCPLRTSHVKNNSSCFTVCIIIQEGRMVDDEVDDHIVLVISYAHVQGMKLSTCDVMKINKECHFNDM